MQHQASQCESNLSSNDYALLHEPVHVLSCTTVKEVSSRRSSFRGQLAAPYRYIITGVQPVQWKPLGVPAHRAPPRRCWDASLCCWESLVCLNCSNRPRINFSAFQVAMEKSKGNTTHAIELLRQYLDTFMTDRDAWAELADLYIQV